MSKAHLPNWTSCIMQVGPATLHPTIASVSEFRPLSTSSSLGKNRTKRHSTKWSNEQYAIDTPSSATSARKSATNMPPSPSSLGKYVKNMPSSLSWNKTTKIAALPSPFAQNAKNMPSSPSSLGKYVKSVSRSLTSSPTSRVGNKRDYVGPDPFQNFDETMHLASSPILPTFDKGDLANPKLFHDFDERLNFTSLYAMMFAPFILTGLLLTLYMISETTKEEPVLQKKSMIVKEDAKIPIFSSPVMQKGGDHLPVAQKGEAKDEQNR